MTTMRHSQFRLLFQLVQSIYYVTCDTCTALHIHSNIDKKEIFDEARLKKGNVAFLRKVEKDYANQHQNKLF